MKGTPKIAPTKKATKKGKLPNYDLMDRDKEELERENLAENGARATKRELEEFNASGPELTGGDLDANWQDAASVGDEAVGGHAPTPDQNIVDDLGRATGFDEDEGELHSLEEKVVKRDQKRWELDRRSADTEPDE
jgi:hypothetical protein